MKLEVFEAIVKTMIDQQNRLAKLIELGVDTYTYESGYVGVVTLLLRAYYGAEGEDLVSWYIYERECSDLPEKPTMIDRKTKEEICYDISSLWRRVEEIRVSNDFVDYELPKPESPNIEQTLEIIRRILNRQ
jgi:hypothetical protein